MVRCRQKYINKKIKIKKKIKTSWSAVWVKQVNSPIVAESTRKAGTLWRMAFGADCWILQYFSWNLHTSSTAGIHCACLFSYILIRLIWGGSRSVQYTCHFSLKYIYSVFWLPIMISNICSRAKTDRYPLEQWCGVSSVNWLHMCVWVHSCAYTSAIPYSIQLHVCVERNHHSDSCMITTLRTHAHTRTQRHI